MRSFRVLDPEYITNTGYRGGTLLDIFFYVFYTNVSFLLNKATELRWNL